MHLGMDGHIQSGELLFLAMFREIGSFLGRRGDPLEAPREGFRKKGIAICDEEIWRLRRAGELTSAEIMERILCADILAGRMESQKLKFLKSYVDNSLDLRRKDSRNIKYVSVGYMEDISANMGLSPVILRFLLRGYRAEALKLAVRDKVLARSLVSAVELYTKEYVSDAPSPSLADRRVQSISDLWNRKKPKQFYRLLSEIKARRGAGTFTAYERDFIDSYYQVLNHGQLSWLDRKVLGAFAKDEPRDRLARQLTSEIGILVTPAVLSVFRASILGNFTLSSVDVSAVVSTKNAED